MSRYEDGYPRRGRVAADQYSSYPPSGAAAPPAYSHVSGPGHTTYNDRPREQARLTYEPEDAYRRSSRSRSRSRSRSTKRRGSRSRSRSRDNGALVRRRRGGGGYSKYSDDEDDDDENSNYYGDRAVAVRSPTGKAKRFVDSTFTDSKTGLGVGMLGALVGGLAAREAVELTSNRKGQQDKDRDRDGDQQQRPHHQRRDDAEYKRNQLISTMVGAAIGALGANAVERRIESRRAQDEAKLKMRERRWRRPEGADPEVLETLEVVAQPRNKEDDPHYMDDWDLWTGDGNGEKRRRRPSRSRSRSRREIGREVDPGARSWTNVDDWRRSVTP